MAHYELDARRLLCPMPVIRTQNRVKELVPGDTLDVYATDPGVKADIPAWCRVHGHAVVEIREVPERRELVVTVRVGG